MGSGRWGYRMGDAQIFDSMLMDGLNDAFSGKHSGWHTEDLAASHQITREEQDRWAERSQKRFSAAQAGGKFASEIAAVEIASRKGPTKFDKDEHNRPETTLESLSKLKPAFRKDGKRSFSANTMVRGRFCGRQWWACLDSNQEPDRYERRVFTGKA